jgi:hypothetical protein
MKHFRVSVEDDDITALLLESTLSEELDDYKGGVSVCLEHCGTLSDLKTQAEARKLNAEAQAIEIQNDAKALLLKTVREKK